jgi:hypothetical protein
MEQYFLSIKRFCAAGVALIVVSFLAIGCGGGGDGDGSEAGADTSDGVTVETGSLTKAQFVKKADKICIDTKGHFERQAATLGKSIAPGEITPRVIASLVKSTLIPDYEELIAQIGSIGAPSGDEEQIATFLNAVQETIDYAGENPEKAFESLNLFAKASKLAKEYGLSGCSVSLV